MRRHERWLADIGVLRAMARGMPKQGTLAQRLTGFYADQAGHYDRFRERLLQGRDQLIADLALPPRARIADLGGGTGRNIEFFAERIEAIARYDVVDLCRPLLDQAHARTRRWPQMHVIHADAAHWQPDELVDAVILSYALSMMPTWPDVLANALSMLKPGGQLAAIDFYVSDAAPAAGRVRHGAFVRRFWPAWFGHDGVRLDAGPLSALCDAFPGHRLTETRATVPYLPLLRVPCYRFLGRKP